MTSTEKIIPDEESVKTAAALDDKVKDNFQRPLISLRISITNRCNVKCFYCHHDGMVAQDYEMTAEEIERIVEVAKDSLGVNPL